MHPKAENPPTLLDHARALAEDGFLVFPLKINGKTPAFEEWQELATDDLKEVDRLWRKSTKRPDGVAYNVGVKTSNEIVVLDVDMKKGKNGLKTLSEIQNQHTALPSTLSAVTATGGLHIYLRNLSDHDVHNSAGRLGDGLDVRGEGGYVVAPGSVIDGKLYRWRNERSEEINEAPEWFVQQAKHTKVSKAATNELDPLSLDAPDNISRAIQFLMTTDPAIESYSGDEVTFKTAARLKDLGVSESMALHLLDSVFNPRCEPPWTFGDLNVKVKNAYRYGQNSVGVDTPEANFDDVQQEVSTTRSLEKTKPYIALKPSPVQGFTPETLPATDWLIDTLVVKRKLTLIIAPGGVGKSLLSILMCLSLATGRDDIIGLPINKVRKAKIQKKFGDKPVAARHLKGKAWLINNEDDEDMLLKRVFAAMKLHKIKPADLLDKNGNPTLFVNSGEFRPFKIARKLRTKSKNNDMLKPADAAAMLAHIKENNIDLVSVDPYVETHDGDENDNVETAQVAQIYRQVAQKGECGIAIVHHTRKPPQAASTSHVGNADSGRGASALSNAVRISKTVFDMDPDSAESLNVNDENRWQFVRMDDAKANLGPRSGAPTWYRKVSVELPTSDGVPESVGAIRPATDQDFIQEAGFEEVEGNDKPGPKAESRSKLARETVAWLLTECDEQVAGLEEWKKWARAEVFEGKQERTARRAIKEIADYDRITVDDQGTVLLVDEDLETITVEVG